ncbi:MAG: PASTA domain-containing protein [Acidobacteriota bacterium]
MSKDKSSGSNEPSAIKSDLQRPQTAITIPQVGNVIAQDPPAGVAVPVGSTVTIEVGGSGPGPGPLPTE